ncbi:hypothetical protein KC207_06110 [Phycicoccus sp. BSK3Z-2]|uniref:N-acetyltransferase domain-containing protein n=1 Tax=Phycicoccus avicenniae TaxID=2828860 RepID=A0A941I071_9MICO|nr:hypothetical protein [Phycicoccus avicenniae]MBR7742864.1 hypothetical protein [Phycicoccus avicenniae]
MSGRDGLTLVDADEVPADEWRAVYRTVLAPAFPPEELVSEAGFLAQRGHADAHVWFARVGEGPWCGVALVETGHADGTALLAYLAASAAARGRGVGSALLSHVRERHPMLFVEVEDPAVHTDRGFGDPSRRVAFYDAHGVREVVVPFVMPPVAPGLPRVPGILLGLARPAADTPDRGEEHVPADAVRSFLTGYVLEDDGVDAEDARVLGEALQADTLVVRPLLPRP